jgi:ribosomal protein S18 acetylase RimI-like enzyme
MTSDITDTAAMAIVQSFGWLGAAVTDGSALWINGTMLAMASGALVQELNGVLCGTTGPDAAEISELAGYVAALGLPWAIQLRTRPSAEIAKVAASYGLTEREEIPLMVRENLAELADVPDAELAAVRRAGAADSDTYLSVLSAGFEVTPQMWGTDFSSQVLGAGGGEAYLAQHDGRAVSTGFGVREDDTLCVFNVSTLPGYRRRGYGRAVSLAALRDGARSGANLAALQATPEAVSLYRSLGFRTAETWTALIAPEPPGASTFEPATTAGQAE